ncbi:Hypothetical predicted protein [Mytilus galloprovincialis]|uniref:C2H2-type domain-containing protein n=1 Tax=Mytilus galloprovincialis TaxID=29158 RepID=A0A8B6DRY3_MYTGA|nr:Hypothetical predicted protein [Mytilus galloprovincialis]
MSKSDFLSWDDDLDDFELAYLLGDYTDTDTNADSVSACKKPKKDIQCSGYMCPDCKKVLKTISGFRGHTAKQHGKSNLKAFQHRIQNGEVLQDQITTPQSDKSQQSTMTAVTLDSIFQSAYNNTLICIEEDPMYNIFGESTIVQIAKSISDSVEVKTFFYDLFREIFNSNPNLSLNHDRELFFTKFHALRLSSSIDKGYTDHFSQNGFTPLDNKNFIQIVMLELINQLLSQQTIQEQKSSDINHSELSENDQNILYYICGYIIRACEKRYSKLKGDLRSMKINCIEQVKSTSTTNSFVSKYNKWTEKKDRGGLIMPSDNFYLLTREFETVVRKHLGDQELNAKSLLHDKLKELIMESFMVKYYSEQIFVGIDYDDYVLILEDIIHLFLTIRGFSTAKVIRNKMIKDKVTSKKSLSLRQVLKEKHNN